ncbi:MAG: histidine kinase [Lachnospiraceae bacterium]|nr:histidine kinase [Lachnospiraceae bacterium]
MDDYCIGAALICLIQLFLQFAGVVDLRDNLAVTHIVIAAGVLIVVVNVIYERVKYPRKVRTLSGKKFPLICLAGVVADDALICFSRYLRKNINIIEEEGLIDFSKELAHLEDYIALEQIRFQDMIIFEKEIEETNFKIPPLTIQPIIENAIKHGLVEHGRSGTVRLHTRRVKKRIPWVSEMSVSAWKAWYTAASSLRAVPKKERRQ